MLALLAATATFTVQIVNDSGATLEPSVVNEVEHALSRAAAITNLPPVDVKGDVFGTNGLSAANVAVSLVSRQDAKGCWVVNGTNFTAEAVKILSSLLEPGVPERPPVVHDPVDGNRLR